MKQKKKVLKRPQATIFFVLHSCFSVVFAGLVSEGGFFILCGFINQLLGLMKLLHPVVFVGRWEGAAQASGTSLRRSFGTSTSTIVSTRLIRASGRSASVGS